MGYVPLFETLTTGTLHGKWPDIGLWPVLLSMADRFGNVDVTPQYIAGVTGLDVPEVISCLERFCAPDPDSRSDVNEGRRLEPMEEGRKWGWHVVNHSKYREKARMLAKDSQRTATGMDAARKAASRAGACPPKSPEVPLSDGDGDVYEDKKDLGAGAAAPPRKKSPVSRARTQVPEGDWLTPADLEFARSRLRDMNIEATFDDFKNHHTAKGTLAVDWHAAWRTWIGNCVKGFSYVRRSRQSMESAEPTYSPAEYRALQAAKAGNGGG